MCNRYTLTEPGRAFDELARVLGVTLVKPEWVVERYNQGLIQSAPTIVDRGAGPEIMAMQFGNSPHGRAAFGNARVETIFEKPTFKAQAPTHRCLIPTTGFIDWETDERGNKWPHLYTLMSGRPYAMAAIWNPGSEKQQVPPHFYIVTTEPNDLVRKCHDRMPIILPEEAVARWVDPAPMGEAEFRELAKTYPAVLMRDQLISEYVNSVRHEGPACLAPAHAHPDQLGLGL